jgi:hypothetical protein
MELYRLKKILKKATFCLACIEASRKSQVYYIKAKKSLADLLLNTTKKARDSEGIGEAGVYFKNFIWL